MRLRKSNAERTKSNATDVVAAMLINTRNFTRSSICHNRSSLAWYGSLLFPYKVWTIITAIKRFTTVTTNIFVYPPNPGKGSCLIYRTSNMNAIYVKIAMPINAGEMKLNKPRGCSSAIRVVRELAFLISSKYLKTESSASTRGVNWRTK